MNELHVGFYIGLGVLLVCAVLWIFFVRKDRPGELLWILFAMTALGFSLFVVYIHYLQIYELEKEVNKLLGW